LPGLGQQGLTAAQGLEAALVLLEGGLEPEVSALEALHGLLGGLELLLEGARCRSALGTPFLVGLLHPVLHMRRQPPGLTARLVAWTPRHRSSSRELGRFPGRTG